MAETKNDKDAVAAYMANSLLDRCDTPKRGAEGYLIPTTCVECGKSGEARVDNPAVIHKTVLCKECKAKETFDPLDFLY